MTVCGTGNWTGPKPGDPDSNVLLSATSVFGGVKVSWTMPQLFPYAVAHIRIYRAIIQDYASSIEIATVNASSFIDINEDGLEKQYYYWITIVSVNGTDSPLIGPASALSRPHIDGMIELLTGKIEQGALSIALKGEIDNISLLGTSITDEVAARMAANAALGLTITGLDGQLVNAMTVLDSEVNERITADSAIVTSLDLMAVGFNSSVAGLAEEIILQTGPTSALSQKITTLEATVDGDTVTGQIGLTAEVDTVTNTVAGLYTAKIDVNGLVGGFGLSNNGAEVEAGFDVDRFWVGRSAVDPVTGLVTQVKPFIIEGTEVFINDAVINKLTFSKLTDELGGVIVENGIIRADLLDLDWDQVTGIYKPANGATRNVYKGLWTSGTPYLLGDNVIYDGNSWECIFSHASDALNHPPIYPITSNAQWNIVAIRGQGQVKGVAFARGASAVAPTGGSFFSPNPTTVGWSDGIPVDDNTPLWMSTRLFTSDAEAPQQSVWSTPAKIGTPSIGTKTQFSVDGSTLWHDTPATADVYMRTGTSINNGATWGYAGAVKIKGELGQGQVKGISFLRAATIPATPVGGTYSSPNATGWSDGIPADNNLPLWQTTRIFTSDSLTPHQSGWTTPAKIGTPSTGAKTQFSVDGFTLWHDVPATDDYYMRSGTSTDNGVTWTYSGSVKIKGEVGQGQVKSTSFIRAATQPSTPVGGSYADPNATGWSDGIPADNNQPLWQVSRLFTSDGLTPQDATWSTPAKVGTPSIGAKTQFSSDGSTLWHDVPVTNDYYMRSGTSTDNGVTWAYAGAVKIKGETGVQGVAGIDGAQGTQGIQGVAGSNGITYYTWVKYADDASGTNLSDFPSGKAYLGIAYNKTSATESTTAADYTWSLIQGSQGIQGATGIDGATTYTWIKYGTSITGAGLNDSAVGMTHIGIAVNKLTATESTVATDYTWALIKGDTGAQGIQGTQGIQGNVGANGVTYYTWVKYADSPTTGMSDFPSGKTYLGIAYNKTTATESTTYADYAWSLIQGTQGIQGAPGGDGATTYTWIKYGTSAAGAGLTDSPTGMTYIGVAVNKTTATESTTAADYTWSLIQGPQGVQGAQGIQGVQGNTGATGATGATGLIDTASRYVLGGSGGLVGGSLTWDPASGVRTSGSGVAVTGKGIVAHNGTKSTVVIDVDGNATFGGTLAIDSGASSRMVVTSDKIEIWNAGVKRVVLGNLA